MRASRTRDQIVVKQLDWWMFKSKWPAENKSDGGEGGNFNKREGMVLSGLKERKKERKKERN